MNNLESDIKAAIKFLDNGTDVKFSKYNPMYLFSTENIYGYIEETKNCKKIVSVCGSGDQAISFVLNKCFKYIVFDMNLLSKYILNLKISAIKSLDYKNFINFFINDKFSHKIFKKIELEEKDLQFWNKLYEHVNFNGQKIYDSQLFIKNNINFYKKNIPYLNENNYNFIKTNILNLDIIFLDCDLYNLYRYINKSIDLIYLSNISDYLNDIKEFNNYINSLKEKSESKIIMSYLYDFSEKTIYMNNINNPKYIKDNIDNYKLYKFNGAYNSIDAIIIKE